jgi:hypothetical protein
MGGFGGGLETIAIEFDPRSILAGIQRVNQDLEGLEGKTSGTTAKLQKDWQGVSDLLLKVSDRSKNSADSYIRSLERQAAAIGKSGIDKLNAQMEQAIKNYGYSETAINKITSAYEKLKKAQEPAENPGEKYKEWGESIAKGIETPAQAAQGAIVGLLGKLGPLGVGLGATVGVAVTAGGAILELSHQFGEWGISARDAELRTGLSADALGKYTYAAKAAGTDISVVERLMKGLTTAIEDTGKAGEKGRAVLEEMGVDIRGVRDGTVSTDQVLQQISKSFEENKNTLLRNKDAIDLFKKAGIEAVPFLTELDENLKHAKEAGFGFRQSMIDAGAETNKELADMGMRWDQVKLKIEGAAASVLTYFHNLAQGKPAPGQPDYFQARKDARQGITETLDIHPTVGGPPLGWDTLAPTPENLALYRSDMNSEAGLKYRLSLAEKSQTDAMKKEATTNPGSAGFSDAHEDYVKAEADVNRLTAALKSLEDAKKAQAEYDKRIKQSYMSPQEYSAQQYAGIVKGGLETAPTLTLGQPHDAVGNYLSDQMQAQARAMKEAAKEEDEAAKASLKFEEQMIKLRNGPDGELATAKQVYDLRMQTATSVLQQYEAGLDYLKQIGDLQAKADKEHEDELEKQAKKQQEMLEKEHDQVQKTATGLYDTLLTHPTQFGKQLQTTFRKQTTSFAAETLGTWTADKLVPGGVKNNDPVKESTDVNTDATIQNSRAIMAMTAHLAAQLGVSAPSIPGQGGVSAISAPAAPAARGGPASIITIPVGGGGALPSPSFGGGGFAPGFIGMPSAAFSAPSVSSSTVALPFFGASSPLFSGGTSDVSFGGGSGFSGTGAGSLGFGSFGGFRGGGGGGAGAGTALSLAGTALRTIGTSGGNPAAMIGPGGTSGFTGPVGGGGTAAYGIKALSNLKSFGSNLGPAFGIGQGGMSSDVPVADSDDPLGPQMAPGGSTTFSSVAGSPAVGALMGSGGTMLAENGLLGNNRGTGMGILEGTAGGALIGYQYGGPIGAAIGATVGFGIGLGEMLAGVESQRRQVINMVKSSYNINISNKEADQIVQLAKQKYGNDISVAVKSLEVRQMLGIYAAGTGQKNSTISAMTPQAGSLVEQGGKLYQQATYQYGQAYTFQSNLPVLGGPVAGNYPNPGGSPSVQNVQINLNGQSAADALEGRVATVVTPSYLADGFAQANQSSNGRTQASADLSQPGLITG